MVATAEQYVYPMDAVVAGEVDPSNLTPDQLFGGVNGVQVFQHNLLDTPEGCFIRTPGGVWQLPVGMTLDVYRDNGHGYYPDRLNTMYVDGERGLRPLQLDEDGQLPADVARRIHEELESLDAARSLNPPGYQHVTRRNSGYFVAANRPDYESPFTVFDQKNLLGTLRREANREARQRLRSKIGAIFNTVIASLIPRPQPTGRHHGYKPGRHQAPRLAF